MSFVLISTTRGDDLIGPIKTNVAVSEFWGVLEKLKAERAAERKAWLAANTLPGYVQGSIIASETIEEVPSL